MTRMGPGDAALAERARRITETRVYRESDDFRAPKTRARLPIRGESCGMVTD